MISSAPNGPPEALLFRLARLGAGGRPCGG